jgi:HAD superfamily hydrolase (TIGR01549 family)
MNTKVVFFDLWKTLVTSHCKEPVWDLQRILGHGINSSGDTVEPTFIADDEFLRHCLTTPIAEPLTFMQETARKFNGAQPTDGGLERFLEVLRQESQCTARYLDVKATVATLIERGYRVGVISNLWAFPASYIFDQTGLGKLFPEESRIYSFEAGFRKPDPEIFYAACERFGVNPEECLMVGDNLEADVRGALKVGMKAALIDRPGEVKADIIPADALALRTLTELLPHLEPRSQE